MILRFPCNNLTLLIEMLIRTDQGIAWARNIGFHVAGSSTSRYESPVLSLPPSSFDIVKIHLIFSSF
jgi:hypothetical protein